jgi:hypothetical protein
LIRVITPFFRVITPFDSRYNAFIRVAQYNNRSYQTIFHLLLNMTLQRYTKLQTTS